MTRSLAELARALREQGERGELSAEIDASLREAGFYRSDLAGLLRAVAELATGSPGAAWCAGSLAACALQVGELTEARCALLGYPAAVAVRAGGHWIVDAAPRRCVGAHFATHVLGEAVIDDRPHVFAAAIDPGAAELVGLSEVAIEEPCMRPGVLRASVPQAMLAAVFAGATSAAVARYEALVRDEERVLDADAQRWLGAGIGRAAAAQLLLGEVAERYAAAAPLRREDDLLLALMARESMRLAWSAVLELARTAGSERGDFEATARELLGGFGETTIPAEETLLRELARERLRIEA